MKIFSIKDTGAGYFWPPFVAKNDQQAVRMFVQGLGESWSFRGDFQLFALGSFDDENGVLVAEDARLVIRGDSLDESADPRRRVQ